MTRTVNKTFRRVLQRFEVHSLRVRCTKPTNRHLLTTPSQQLAEATLADYLLTLSNPRSRQSVSYTHLDVYKRQQGKSVNMITDQIKKHV